MKGIYFDTAITPEAASFRKGAKKTEPKVEIPAPIPAVTVENVAEILENEPPTPEATSIKEESAAVVAKKEDEIFDVTDVEIELPTNKKTINPDFFKGILVNDDDEDLDDDKLVERARSLKDENESLKAALSGRFDLESNDEYKVAKQYVSLTDEQRYFLYLVNQEGYSQDEAREELAELQQTKNEYGDVVANEKGIAKIRRKGQLEMNKAIADIKLMEQEAEKKKKENYQKLNTNTSSLFPKVQDILAKSDTFGGQYKIKKEVLDKAKLNVEVNIKNGKAQKDLSNPEFVYRALELMYNLDLRDTISNAIVAKKFANKAQGLPAAAAASTEKGAQNQATEKSSKGTWK
jgi:hypothetical protein